jgi:hypothetical protein
MARITNGGLSQPPNTAASQQIKFYSLAGVGIRAQFLIMVTDAVRGGEQVCQGTIIRLALLLVGALVFGLVERNLLHTDRTILERGIEHMLILLAG